MARLTPEQERAIAAAAVALVRAWEGKATRKGLHDAETRLAEAVRAARVVLRLAAE